MRRMTFVMAMFVVATAGVAVVPGVSQAAMHMVEIGDSYFAPNFLVVAQGDTITWTHMGQMPHTVTESTEVGSCSMLVGGFDSGTLQNGGAYTWVADRVGDIGYHCEFHCPPMTGEIIVQESTPAEGAAWGAVKSLYR